MLTRIFKKAGFVIQRNFYNVQIRNLLSGIVKIFLPIGSRNEGIEYLNINRTENEIADDLKQYGFSNLGLVISNDKITSIFEKLSKLKSYDTNRSGHPIVDLNNPDDETQLAHYTRTDLSNFEEVLMIANDSKILNVVTSYFGAKPTISNINCWWSFSGRQSAKEAQFFHRDMDDYKFLKMFIYLTDVTEDSGPHIYVKGSHKSNKLAQLKRFSDQEVIDQYGDEEILTLVYPKGYGFIEDTYGIHKGQLPSNGRRLLLQIQYSYLPLFVEKYEPVKSNNVERMGLDPYINRLIVQQK
ncbi:phytanoyl-CoA dioxygenase family protein [Sediminibacterium sp. C3]|uniref:phytanoyl-CoA dioxygenase family protein n=1 Tax=Sediminibacterium sp. C3 TaxID=1267211 RepID=UPI000419291C|nr:phytanoyl-CoA dioxygenase family protein [Sediminibacterium sp. C3]